MGTPSARSGICPACGRVQSPDRATCGRCGAAMDGSAVPGSAAGVLSRLPAPWRDALERAPDVGRGRVIAQAALLLVASWVGVTYLFASLDRSQIAISGVHQLLESANLVFHEAGHWILGVAGIELLTILGGSLLQVAIPALCAVAFLTRHPDPFAAAFCSWWTGQSMVNLAPYVADARAQRLVLLGGVTGNERPGYHDWNNLLGRLGLLEWDRFLGGSLHLAGLAVMAASVVVGFMVLRAQWQATAEPGESATFPVATDPSGES